MKKHVFTLWICELTTWIECKLVSYSFWVKLHVLQLRVVQACAVSWWTGQASDNLLCNDYSQFSLHILSLHLALESKFYSVCKFFSVSSYLIRVDVLWVKAKFTNKSGSKWIVIDSPLRDGLKCLNISMKKKRIHDNISTITKP